MGSKRYRLKTAILSVDPNRETTLLIPEGEIIEIDSPPYKHRQMADILWRGKILLLFYQDIKERCEEVGDA